MESLPVLDHDEQPDNTDGKFVVALDNFTGPFDLLLGLITKRQLDITEIALAQVTDDFIAHMKTVSDLSQTTEFVVVAATLLDMKARSLLPHEDNGGDEDWEYLEARDLLFSRLLQYRAFKEVSAIFGRLWDLHAHRHPREAELEPQYAALLPKLRWSATPSQLARLAADALSRKPPTVVTTHLHDPLVPVRPQAEYIASVLRLSRWSTFTDLCANAPDLNTIVSRFLAILDLYREGLIRFQQEYPLAPLTIEWSGEDTDISSIHIDDENENDHTFTVDATGG